MCGTSTKRRVYNVKKKKDYESIAWQQLRLWGARNKNGIALECVRVAVVVIVAFYLAATVRQTREHAYVSFGRHFTTVLIRSKWQDLDMTAYATVVSPSRLVLDAW